MSAKSAKSTKETKSNKVIKEEVKEEIKEEVKPKVEKKSSTKETSTKESSKLKVVSKTDKKSKPEQKTGSDKGLNKETISVGLMFNVKPYKKWLKTYYQNTNRSSVKIMNAHYMMAAMNEILVFNLLNGASEMIQKQKTGLLDLTLERFMMYIQSTNHILTTFSQFHTRYEPGFDYIKLVPLEKTLLSRFIEKKCFHKNDALNINKDTMNYICYLLTQTNTRCAEIAYVFSQYAKKTTVSGEGIKGAIQVFFNGKLLIDIMTKLEQITRVLKNKSKKDSDKDPGEENEDEDEEDEDEDDEEQVEQDEVSEDEDEDSDEDD
jgi:hypothetical protein